MNLALGVVTTVKPLEIKSRGNFLQLFLCFKVSFFAMFVLVELPLIVGKKNPCNQTE